jgi:hypothetical protein
LKVQQQQAEGLARFGFRTSWRTRQRMEAVFAS